MVTLRAFGLTLGTQVILSAPELITPLFPILGWAHLLLWAVLFIMQAGFYLRPIILLSLISVEISIFICYVILILLILFIGVEQILRLLWLLLYGSPLGSVGSPRLGIKFPGTRVFHRGTLFCFGWLTIVGYGPRIDWLTLGSWLIPYAYCVILI